MKKNKKKIVKKKKSILRKTFFFSALLVLTTLCISFLILVLALPQYYQHYKEVKLKENTELLASQLEQASTDEATKKIIDEFSKKNNAQVWSYDEKGTLLSRYSSLLGTSHSIPSSGGKSKVSIVVENSDDNEKNQKNFTIKNRVNDNYIYSINYKVNNESIKSIDVVGDLQPINEATKVILSLLPYLMGITIVIGLILAYFYSKKITKPILLLSKQIISMKNGSDQANFYAYQPDEIGELSENIRQLYDSLNENSEKLQLEMDKVTRLEKSKTDFMRAAGHELKTPITALAGITESMIYNIGKYKNHDIYLSECKKIIDELAMLISEIVTVSKLDTLKETDNTQHIELSEIITNSLSNLQFLSEEKQLKIAIYFEEWIIKTNEKKITTIINNILSNAVKYTIFNGHIKISMHSDSTKELVIENECYPINSEDVSQFFEPFYTKDTSHSKRNEGTGLGLYIVQKNIKFLGFDYHAEKTELGFLIRILF